MLEKLYGQRYIYRLLMINDKSGCKMVRSLRETRWKFGHEEPLRGGKKEVLSEYTQTWAVFLSHVGAQKDSSFKKKKISK